MYSAQNDIKMNNACTYLSRLGYKATYANVSYVGDTYDLTIEKDGLKYTDGTERIAEPKKLYRIWYKSEDGTESVYAKEYIKEGNAVRVARKIFAGTSTEWLVAKEDPFKNGVWDKAFGSDS